MISFAQVQSYSLALLKNMKIESRITYLPLKEERKDLRPNQKLTQNRVRW